MRCAPALDHRVGQPPLRLEPVVGAPEQVLERVLLEKRWGDAPLGPLGHRRFGAVLAELKGCSLPRRRVRPGAARAVKAVGQLMRARSCILRTMPVWRPASLSTEVTAPRPPAALS